MEELLIKYISGSADRSEKKAVLDWINSDQNNRKEFETLQKAYFVSIWTDNLEPVVIEQEITPIKRKPIWKEILKVAAVLLIGFSLFINIKDYVFNGKASNMEKEIFQSVHVPSGQRVELSLVDGSKVWVNANSKLDYPQTFNEDQRIVFLDGEGQFNIEHNEKIPFIVKTKDFDIQVLGTEFNVKAYSTKGKFETALLQGKVQISSKDGQNKITLKPNEAAVLENGKLFVRPIQNLDPYRWVEGLMTFENESIEDILLKMEDYFDININIKTKNLNKKKYTGKFWIDDGVEDMLEVLQKTSDFNYSRNYDTNEYIIY